jgi:hypothetical protein
LRANQTQLAEEKAADSQQPIHAFHSLLNGNNPPFNAIELIENLVGHSFVNAPSAEEIASYENDYNRLVIRFRRQKSTFWIFWEKLSKAVFVSSTSRPSKMGRKNLWPPA